MRLQHVQQFRVVNLQQHASDLSCQVGMHGLNQWEKTLTCWCKKKRKKKKEINNTLKYIIRL